VNPNVKNFNQDTNLDLPMFATTSFQGGVNSTWICDSTASFHVFYENLSLKSFIFLCFVLSIYFLFH